MQVDNPRHPRGALSTVATALSRLLRGSLAILIPDAHAPSPAAPGVMASPELTLSNLISRDEKQLRSNLPSNVELATDLEPLIANIAADPEQIDRILTCLTSNAIDAMPDGGTLRIATANTSVDVERAIAEPALTPGRYVKLTVSDTGTGMNRTTMARAFDPFFTTKRGGKTTGLSLSMIYEIVQKQNGHILTESTPGRGTTIEIYFPRASSQTISAAGPVWATA